MLVEDLKRFKNVVEKAKEENVDIQSNIFIAYLSFLNNDREEKDFLNNENIVDLLERVVDINLDTDEYTHCSIAEIVDYCIENYEDIDDMDNTEILEDICC